MRRDLGFFLAAYAIAVVVGIVDIGRFRWAVAVLLIVAYGIYVRRTMKSEGDLEGECRSLYFHRTAESPDLPRVILQIIVALAAIIFGADLFVRELTTISVAAGVPDTGDLPAHHAGGHGTPREVQQRHVDAAEEGHPGPGQHHRGDGLPEHLPGGDRPGVHRLASVQQRRVARGRGGRASRCSRGPSSTAGCASPRVGSAWGRFSSEACSTPRSWA